MIRVGGVEQTVKSSKCFCTGFIHRPDIRHVPEERCDLALMLWVLLHKFDEAAERVLVLGRISGAAQHGRRGIRGDTDRLLRERVGLMSGRSVLRQEVRQDATSTAWTLIWLWHKIHHNYQLFGDFGVPDALQVLDFIGSSGRTRTYNPSVNRTINNVLSTTYAE